MELTMDHTTIEIETGSFIFDERSDTYIKWDSLDKATQENLESLSMAIKSLGEIACQTIKEAHENRTTTKADS